MRKLDADLSITVDPRIKEALQSQGLRLKVQVLAEDADATGDTPHSGSSDRELLSAAEALPPGTGKILLACKLLDAARVSNGSKAISIFLHANWTPELASRLGPYPAPATVKRWRTLRSRTGSPK